MLRNLKVGVKMMLGFAIVLGLAITLGVVSIVNMTNVGAVSTELAQEAAPMVKWGNEVERWSLLTMYANRGYGFTGNEKFYQQGQENIQKVEEALVECFNLAEREGIDQLKADATECQAKLELYGQLVDQTRQTNQQLEQIRGQMDLAAGQYMSNCADFLAGQNKKMHEDVAERQKKITLVADIQKLGNETRVTNFKAQALKDPQMLQQAIDGLDKAFEHTAELRTVTQDDEDIARIDATEAAAKGYKQAMVNFLAEFSKEDSDTAKLDALRGSMDQFAAQYMTACGEFLDGQNAKLTHEVNERLAKIDLVTQIIQLGNDARVKNFQSQAMRDPQAMREGLALFPKMNEKFTDLRKITYQKADLDRIDNTEQAAGGYSTAMSSFLDEWIALQELGTRRNDAGEVVLELAQKTAKSGVDTTQTSANNAVSELNSASFIMVVGLAIVVALGVGIAFVITRGLTKPINNIVDRIKDIAQGEGDLTQRVDASSRDEIGELGRWFNTFVQKVHDIIAEVAGSAGDVASAATEIAASSEEMAQGMRQQTEQATQVSAAVEQMSATVVEVARKSADAADTSNRAGQQATEGGQVVQETVDAINTISGVVNESADAIGELGKLGEQIGQVVGVINDIADQTNLLALNAAIEAARAGEHGRGFAVVADEVRKLAERTTTATEEVAESIRAIQDGTSGAVQRMQTGTERVSQGVELAQKAGNSLQEIVGGSRSVAEMIQSIAAAAEQQSASAEQISRNVENITAVTKQSTEGAEQAAAAAAQLSAKSEQLQRLVGQFKLADNTGPEAAVATA